MRVVITGSKGFVGRELVLQCQNQGLDVIGIDIDDVDIRSPNVARFFPQEIDALVHLAAISKSSDYHQKAYDCFDVNVMGTLNLMRMALQRNVRQFIFSSSEWVYGESKDVVEKTEDEVIDISRLGNEYALSKFVSEANIKQQFLQGFCPTTILRFSIIYGPRKSNWSAVESLFNSVKMQAEVNVGSLRTARRFIYIDDVVSSIMAALDRREEGLEVYNVSGDELVSLKDVVDTSARLLGRNPIVVETNPENYSVRNPSNNKIKKNFGWHPKIDIETGLKTLVNFYERKL